MAYADDLAAFEILHTAWQKQMQEQEPKPDEVKAGWTAPIRPVAPVKPREGAN